MSEEMITLPHDIAIAPLEVREHYLKCIADGQTPRFAEMVALSSPPGTTGMDRTFMEGRNNMEWLSGMPKRQADRMVREARSAGIDVAGKYYVAGIADKRGFRDPSAWVTGRDDVLRVAKQRNLEVRGQINYTPPEAPPKPAVGLKKSVVKELAAKEMAKNKSLSKAQAEGIVREKHTPRWKRAGSA